MTCIVDICEGRSKKLFLSIAFRCVFWEHGKIRVWYMKQITKNMRVGCRWKVQFEKKIVLIRKFFPCVILTTYWEFNWKMFKIYWLFRAIIFAELKSIKFANEPIEMAHYILLNSTNYHFWWRWRLVQRGLLIF